MLLPANSRLTENNMPHDYLSFISSVQPPVGIYFDESEGVSYSNPEYNRQLLREDCAGLYATGPIHCIQLYADECANPS